MHFLCWLTVVSPIFAYKLNNVEIKDLRMNQCDSNVYPVTVSDLTIEIGKKPKITVSGSLSTSIDLYGPIKADLTIKKDIWGVWIPVPCENGVGSCTFMDLCQYGVPQDKQCPQDLIDNHVPCRCPISKGNYTIKPKTFEQSNPRDLLSGTYKGTIKITGNSTLISCYKINFELEEEYIGTNSVE